MNRPTFKRELGALSVAVFENEREGDRPAMRSISVARRYYDRQSEEWKSSAASLNPNDVPAMVRLLQSVEQWLIENSREVAHED